MMEPEKIKQECFPLTLQQGVLALGMARERGDATVSYQMDSGGVKHLDVLADMDTGTLVEKFRSDPQRLLAYARQNMMAIMRDRNLPQNEKKDRAERYIDALIDLQLELDHRAFPSDDRIVRGIPDYIPDQLTDMGKDPDPNPNNREREKIRVDKAELFSRARELIDKIYTTDFGENPDMGKVKEWIIGQVAYYIYTELKYSGDPGSLFGNVSRSVNIVETQDRKEAVCRHQALYAQILLQFFGIMVKLLKCQSCFGVGGELGSHSCNLVRVNGQWHILDVTNPDSGHIYMPEIPEREIDLNGHEYIWRVPRQDKFQRFTYRSHNNMYSKVSSGRV